MSSKVRSDIQLSGNPNSDIHDTSISMTHLWPSTKSVLLCIKSTLLPFRYKCKPDTLYPDPKTIKSVGSVVALPSNDSFIYLSNKMSWLHLCKTCLGSRLPLPLYLLQQPLENKPTNCSGSTRHSLVEKNADLY